MASHAPGEIWVVPAILALIVVSFLARLAGDHLLERWRRTHPPKRRRLPR